MSNGRILVVDDEPQILRAVQMKLRGAGYAVDTAATAQERWTREQTTTSPSHSAARNCSRACAQSSGAQLRPSSA
jgi:CheY-like chemotaxis protein